MTAVQLIKRTPTLISCLLFTPLMMPFSSTSPQVFSSTALASADSSSMNLRHFWRYIFIKEKKLCLQLRFQQLLAKQFFSSL